MYYRNEDEILIDNEEGENIIIDQEEGGMDVEEPLFFDYLPQIAIGVLFFIVVIMLILYLKTNK